MQITNIIATILDREKCAHYNTKNSMADTL